MRNPNAHIGFSFWLAASIGIGSSATAAAAPPDTSSWECKYCPFESGPRGTYDTGIAHVSDDAARYGNGTGFDESGAYLLLDGEGSHAGDNVLVDWQLADLGVDSRSASVEVSNPGLFDVGLSYRGIPYRLFDTTSTVFDPGADFSLQLPADWVRADVTSGFSALDANLGARNIQSDRDVIELGGSYQAAPRMAISANYRRQTRDGVRMTGASFFSNASLLPQPFDYATDEVDVALSWRGEQAQATIGFYLSLFQNQAVSTRWSNPFNSLPGGDNGALAQAPDNSFRQLTFTGGFDFAESARFSLSAALGRAEQDDILLSYTVNPLLQPDALPRTRLDGRVDSTNVAAALSVRPSGPIGFTLRYRYDDRDNQTPQDAWSRVITDSLLSGASETNTPYSFRRGTFSADVDAELRDNLKLSARVEREGTDRDFQEVAEQTEDTGWGRLRWDPLAYLALSLRAGTSKRKIDRYNNELAVALGQNPLLRKYNLAHRYREFGELNVSASLPQAPLSLGASIIVANDDYSKSQLGLLSSDEITYSADLSWAPGERTVVYLNAALSSIEADQAGSAGFAAPDWFATNDDEFLSIGLGTRIRDIAEGLDLSIDYSHGDGVSKIVITDITAVPQAFPQLESDLDSVTVALNYNQSDRFDWRAELRYEQFETRDWALQNVAPATIPTVLSLGASPYNYEVVQAGLRFRYRYATQ